MLTKAYLDCMIESQSETQIIYSVLSAPHQQYLSHSYICLSVTCYLCGRISIECKYFSNGLKSRLKLPFISSFISEYLL